MARPPGLDRFLAAVHGRPGDPRTFRPAPAADSDEPSYDLARLTRWEVVAWHEPRRRALPRGVLDRVTTTDDLPDLADGST